MNTAAASSTTSDNEQSSTVGFAIPINTALSIASQMQQGQSSSAVHIGLPAFLGVDVESASSAGGGNGGVFSQTPAQTAGLVSGDVITAANGTTITSQSSLSAVIAAESPGASLSLTWVDSSDNSHTATVTLGTGPPA